MEKLLCCFIDQRSDFAFLLHHLPEARVLNPGLHSRDLTRLYSCSWAPATHGVRTHGVCVVGLTHLQSHTKGDRHSSSCVLPQTFIMSPIEPVLHFPNFFHLILFFFFLSCLLKSTHPPDTHTHTLDPQLLFFFSNLRISSCLRVKVGKTAGATVCTKHRRSDPI